MLKLVAEVLLFISAPAIIVLVLLHSGRGGGLSDMFGGGAVSSAMGSTVVERNLDRLTLIVSLVFVFSALTLAILLQP